MTLEISTINSYPTIFAIGHRAITNLFDGPVLVEEKVDGSQFSFALLDGEKYAKAKKQVLYPREPESGGMFRLGLETVNALDLHEGWIYRGEYLQKPKHNTLAYDHVPPGNIILYDVATSHETYLSPADKATEAERLGLMVVPMVHEGPLDDIEQFKALLDTMSCLGGTNIEGLVVKNYNQWTMEKKVAMGKYVSEAFKEAHTSAWKQSNPTARDFIADLGQSIRSEARWQKSIQHLRDEGKLEDSPRDIGPLLKAINEDIKQEMHDDLAQQLFKHYWPHLARVAIAGFPEWYKDQLLATAFDGDNGAENAIPGTDTGGG